MNLTQDQKDKAVQQKMDMIEQQEGLCFYCHKPFTQEDPPQASHRIIKKYIFAFGYDVINHPENVPICHATCNQKVIINPYTQTGKDHVKRIQEAIDNE